MLKTIVKYVIAGAVIFPLYALVALFHVGIINQPKVLLAPFFIGSMAGGFIGYWRYNFLKTKAKRKKLIKKLKEEVEIEEIIRKNLERSEEEWRRSFKAIPELLFVVDRDHTIIKANKKDDEFPHFDLTNIVGKKCFEWAHDIDDFPGYCPMEPFISNDLDIGEYENRVFTIETDVGDRTVFITHTLLLDQNQKYDGCIYMIKDITDEIKAKRENEKIKERMARMERMESVGLLASGVAHDLNNILSGIVTYPEMILMDLDEDSKFRHDIEEIHLSGKKAAAVVSDLLTISRGVSVVKEPASLNDIIKSYTNSIDFKDMVSDLPHEIIIDLQEELPNIECSTIHITKILMNLVTNGLEVMKEKGVLKISTFSKDLLHEQSGYMNIPPGNYVVMKVEDSGPGIPYENLKSIFEPFFTRKKMGKSGTGLGLAIVWNSVMDHNGFIDIDVSENGTSFFIYFNKTTKTITKSGEKSIDELKGDNAQILVIDDEKIQRQIAESLLKQLNYEVETVSSGEEAIELIKIKDFDLLIIDMLMGEGLDGFETYTRIQEIKKDMKAVVISGMIPDNRMKSIESMGVCNIVKKPYTILELGEAVKDAMSRQ